VEKLASPLFFIDTSAFVTLADRGEERHERAVEFIAGLPAHSTLVTSDFVVDETITRIRTLLGVDAAYQMAKEILASGKYDVTFITRGICLQALEKMKKFSDKPLSFTDCTSFVVMDQRRIKNVFAFDDDFVRAGYTVHPKI